MDRTDVTPREVALAVGYLLVGAAGTLATGLLALLLLQPVQPHVYRVFYLALGPWDATETAQILHFAAAGLLAVGLPVLVVEGLHGRVGEVARAAGWLAGVLTVLVAVLSVAAFLGVLSFLAVLVAFAVVVAGLAAALHRFDVSRVGVLTVVGGLPVLALLLLLLGFGLGWGGGVVLEAEPVAGDGRPASMAAVPEVRADLFAARNCEPDDGDVCRLELRGYAHDAAAARFLADHGVRCPFPGEPVDGGSMLVEHDGTTYRLRCGAYGD